MIADPLPVFSGECLRAYYYPGGTGKLMVTFDFRQQGRTGFRPPNYSNSFARMGHAQLSIRSARNDWFINSETEALESAVARLAADHARVQMLGYSMGGYGALRLAAVLRADSAVLVSPQATLDRAWAPFETRYPAESALFDPVLGDLRGRGSERLRGVVLVDPFIAEDMAHAALIAPLFPGLARVRLGFGGHPAASLVIDSGKGWLVQHAAAARRVDAGPLRAAHRAARRQSARYWLRLAKQAQARHPDLAATAQARAEMLVPAPDPAG